METGRLGIRLLGELEVELDGCPVALPAGRARELLAWFALAPGPHPRGRVAGAFWPAAPEPAARASLRSTVWALRAALGPAAEGHLIADRACVGLRAEGLTVDLAEFARLAADGRDREAMALCRGELLPSFEQDWAVTAREEHQVRVAALLAQTARTARESGELGPALAAAGQRLALRPYDEDAAAELMELLAASGNRPAALAVHAGLRRRLQRELGIAEGPELAALARRLRAADRAEAGPRAAPAPTRVRGRGAEVAALDRAWREAAQGRGSVVALAGDGGMGKTLLVTELRRRLDDEGVRTLAGYADALADGVPFALWAEVLAEVADPGDRAEPRVDPHAEHLRQLEHSTQLLLRVAREGPLLLVLEDVHRADPSSLDLLAYAGRRLAGQSFCLVVLTRRRLPGHRRLDAVLAALHASGSVSAELELAPLPDAVLKQLALEQPGLTVTQAARIARLADGNPLLAVEAARAAALRDADLAAGLRGAVHAAISRLTPTARQAVTYIAAAGRPLSMPELRSLPLPDASAAATEALSSGLLLADASGIGFRHALLRDACYADLPGPQRAATHAALAVALAARSYPGAEASSASLGATNLVSSASGAAGAAAGDGDSTRPGPHRPASGGAAGVMPSRGERARSEAAEAGGRGSTHPAASPERASVGASVPAAGGVRHAETGRARFAAELGRHLRLAGEPAAAAARYAEAAGAARGVCALREAAGFLREALALVPDTPELLVELAEVEAWQGRLPESDAAFERALELIAPEDAESQVHAWLRRGYWLRGGVCHPRESRRSFTLVLDLLDRSPESHDPGIRAEALAGLAWAHAVAGDPAEVDRILREVAEVIGRRTPSDLLANDIGLARGHALIRAGQFTDSFAPLIAGAAAAGRAGRPELAYSCLINAASAAACAGDWERALDFTERCLAVVVPNGLLRSTVCTHSARTAVLCRLGRTAEARVACTAGEEVAARTGLADLIALTHHDRGQLALAEGDPTTAAAELAEALALAEAPVSRPRTRLLLAETLARAGRPEEATAQLRAAALEPVSLGDFPETLVARMSHVQGLIALAEGDARTAAARLRESAAAWERSSGRIDGDALVGSLIDLGRPPISALVEPARELAAVRADLAAVAAKEN
ncbi:DNA-binding SARP family transcriptional activator [Streptacidiphilus sp. MAP12-20]|uniref:ATP-binding protein n=1 Tax=Streptacidiphilus sp. MAP12-20 TaxID=3156299 RepID=UPI0035158226